MHLISSARSSGTTEGTREESRLQRNQQDWSIVIHRSLMLFVLQICHGRMWPTRLNCVISPVKQPIANPPTCPSHTDFAGTQTQTLADNSKHPSPSSSFPAHPLFFSFSLFLSFSFLCFALSLPPSSLLLFSPLLSSLVTPRAPETHPTSHTRNTRPERLHEHEYRSLSWGPVPDLCSRAALTQRAVESRGPQGTRCESPVSGTNQAPSRPPPEATHPSSSKVLLSFPCETLLRVRAYE